MPERLPHEGRPLLAKEAYDYRKAKQSADKNLAEESTSGREDGQCAHRGDKQPSRRLATLPVADFSADSNVKCLELIQGSVF